MTGYILKGAGEAYWRKGPANDGAGIWMDGDSSATVYTAEGMLELLGRMRSFLPMWFGSTSVNVLRVSETPKPTTRFTSSEKVV